MICLPVCQFQTLSYASQFMHTCMCVHLGVGVEECWGEGGISEHCGPIFFIWGNDSVGKGLTVLPYSAKFISWPFLLPSYSYSSSCLEPAPCFCPLCCLHQLFHICLENLCLFKTIFFSPIALRYMHVKMWIRMH